MKSIRSLGPALIVAAVVCGPGSILTASKVGAAQGYGMLWVLVLAVLLMIGATALAARIGVGFAGTPCEELARRLGKPVAFLFGLIIFLVCVGFQTSNNIALAAGSSLFTSHGFWVTTGLTFALCALVAWAPDLYKPVERAMKILIFLMVVAFLANFFAARPSLPSAVAGLVPRLPQIEGNALFAVVGLVATTFSLAGAFYQSYLVRDRGWGPEDVRSGARDSVVGICVLGGITGVIMMTAAATFFGREPAVVLKSVDDVAEQLKPLFGTWAQALFGVGIMAGALSSFLVNAMIGGRFLADGFGAGAVTETRAVRACTIAALLVGWLGFLFQEITQADKVHAIVVAQACTVLGVPLLALALLFLGTRPDLPKAVRPPLWVLILTALGFLVTLILSWRTGLTLWG